MARIASGRVTVSRGLWDRKLPERLPFPRGRRL